jgi:hypothetical protein
VEPSRDIGWVVSSECAETLGEHKLGLDYARRGTAAAPKSPATWVQASHEESRYGNKQVAAEDMQRARLLIIQLKLKPTPHRT